MSSPDGAFDTLRRAIQAVEDRATATSSAPGPASEGSNPTPPPLPHLEPINKILANMPKRNIETEKDGKNVINVFNKQGKTLILPKDSSSPLESWRVLLPVIPEMDARRSLNAHRCSKLPIFRTIKRGTYVASSNPMPSQLPQSRPAHFQIHSTRESGQQELTPGTMVVSSRSRQHSSQHIRRFHVESSTIPHYRSAVTPGIPHYHMMPLVAHSHPLRQPQPYSTQHHYGLMHPLPPRPPSTFAVPVGPSTSVLAETTHPHPRPSAVPRVGREISSAEERKRIEALVRAENVSGDRDYTPEQLAKMTKRMLNRASVQKCRRKQRDRANRLEQERNSLITENDVLRRVKTLVEQSGAYEIVRRIQQAQAAGITPTATVISSLN